MFSWMSEKIKMKETEKYGKGMFALEHIKKDSTLLVFGGHVLTREQEEGLPQEIRDIAIQIDKNFVIGVINSDELADTDYVNHSCDPNTGIKGQITLKAMRDIAPGEEITFDYGTVLFRQEAAPVYELECLCDSEKCRGKITQNDWQNSALQERYAGYFPYYIAEEIEKIKNKSC
jgi:uncharacterized protein